MTFLGVPYWLMGVLALGVAVVFVFIYPHKPASGLGYFLVRWGHSLVWVFLAVAAFLAPTDADLARKFAAMGGLTYALFMFSTFSK